MLNWSDGTAMLGGSVLRPPKSVWLLETPAEKADTQFEVFQVFDNIVRRVLAHVGGKTERKIEVLPTALEGNQRYSTQPWNLPAATGMRMRAIYEFRNDDGVRSAHLMAHKLGDPRVKGTGGGDVGLEHLAGIPLGFKGEVGIEANLLFATDPVVRTQILRAGVGGADSIEGLLLEYFEELAPLLPEGVDPGQALEACQEMFSPYLPSQPMPDWVTGEPTTAGGEGDAVPLRIGLDLASPGRSLVAIQITDPGPPERVAVSEIFALQVGQDLQARLLKGAEIGVENVELVYYEGSLELDDLQSEIARMWSSLATDPELAKAVRASGIEVADLPELAPPVRVLEGVAGAEPGELLVIATGHAAASLWREVILPGIRARFEDGAILDEPPPA